MSVELLRRRFDVDEYHRMAEAGILRREDRVELIDGEILAMTPIGPRHNASVDRANRALVLAVGEAAIVRVQGSIRLDRFHEPEPDLVLLRPQADFYASHLPGPDDVLLVVEIAESSLQFDRDVKNRIYADAGVPEYWLVDVDARVLFRHAEPVGDAYRDVRRFRPHESIAPAALPACVVPVASFMAD